VSCAGVCKSNHRAIEDRGKLQKRARQQHPEPLSRLQADGRLERFLRYAVERSKEEAMMRIRSMAARSGAILLLATAGCATHGDVGNARNDAQEALRIAREADAKATQAAADAAAARQAAENAEQQARMTTERSDRIYQRSIQK
jgi:uncharacterized protein YciI